MVAEGKRSATLREDKKKAFHRNGTPFLIQLRAGTYPLKGIVTHAFDLI